jgi:hypothetical protein
MSTFAKLRQDHADIVRIVGAFEEVIARPSPPPQLELFDLRRQLTSTLIAHLKSEDWVLYPRLMASGDAATAAAGRAFNAEMTGIASAYSDYAGRWGAAAIERDWPAYCAESRAVIDALMGRITRENRELLPLLEAIEKAA